MMLPGVVSITQVGSCNTRKGGVQGILRHVQ
jgi:hypothetical protein